MNTKAQDSAKPAETSVVDESLKSTSEVTAMNSNHRSPAVDLSGLTRYDHRGCLMEPDQTGDYLLISDVRNLFASPARDVGGLTPKRAEELYHQALGQPLRECDRPMVLKYASAIEREILASKRNVGGPAPRAKDGTLVPDSQCKQGKCARNTTGCWGKCALSGADNVQIITLANANGIDTDTDGDIWGSTTGALFKFADALLATKEAEPVQAWKPLSDVQWMNIVNHDHAWENHDKESAVHEAVKMTEAKLKEINTATSPAPSVKQEPSVWRGKFDELLSDYAGACSETAVFNVTQQSGMTVRMARPRYNKLIEFVESFAAPSASQGEVKVPEGFVVIPKALTAENGAKSALIGEFKEVIQVPCHECSGDDSAGCENCEGTGTVSQSVPIGWSNIKAIYSRAVELFAAPAPSVTDGGVKK